VTQLKVTKISLSSLVVAGEERKGEGEKTINDD
jgi:hypothetical protein